MQFGSYRISLCHCMAFGCFNFIIFLLNGRFLDMVLYYL